VKRQLRLTRTQDIQRVRKDGRSLAHRFVVIVFTPNQCAKNRTAVIAGRSVGGAVQRNKAKRRLRAAFQGIQSRLHQGYDLVVIARKPLLDADFGDFVKALETLFQNAGLMKEKSP
jgi:ribonuclease P protein component